MEEIIIFGMLALVILISILILIKVSKKNNNTVSNYKPRYDVQPDSNMSTGTFPSQDLINLCNNSDLSPNSDSYFCYDGQQPTAISTDDGYCNGLAAIATDPTDGTSPLAGTCSKPFVSNQNNTQTLCTTPDYVQSLPIFTTNCGGGGGCVQIPGAVEGAGYCASQSS
jgi:hypothetical protein